MQRAPGSRRRVALALALLALAGPVGAAQAEEAPLTERGREIDRALKARAAARRELRAGWILTGLGLGCAAAGTAILGYGFEHGEWSEFRGLLISGSVFAALGGAMTLPGIILALHGQDRLTDVEWQLKQLGVVPMIAAIPGGGARAGVAFAF